MEESKELQGFYKIFRAVIYISVLMEFFEYAIDPSPMGSIVCDLHSRIKQWMICQDGNMAYSKIATFLLVCMNVRYAALSSMKVGTTSSATTPI